MSKVSLAKRGNGFILSAGALVVGLLGSEVQAQQCTTTGANQTCTNAIFLSGGVSGIADTATLTVTNLQQGMISGSTFGVNAADVANVTNFGTISGGVFGINATNAANVVNSGSISGGIGISASTSNVTNNTGTISGTIIGISANVATVKNSGSLSGGTFGIFTTNATVANSGTIVAGAGGTVISASSIASVTNSGTIAGGAFGISANFAAVSNSGLISGSNAGISSNGGNVSNAGAIIGGSGIIVGQSSAIMNAGAIIGSGGTAIDFVSGTNTLTLAPGFAITGKVIGTGADAFQLGGTGSGTFALGLIGPAQQYQGFSTFNKVDSSTWTVTGTYSQSNAWQVQRGTLLVNGDLSAATGIKVDTGGVLGGIGTVSNPTIENGGTLAPGTPSSIGTLHVTGNLVFATASSYLVQVSPTAASLSTVSGTALIGGTLIANGTGGAYTVGQKYVILSASGGAMGTFSSLRTEGTFGSTVPTVAYDANDAFLVLAPAALNSHLPAGSRLNVRNVADAIDAANVGTPPLAFQNLFNLPPQQLQNALTQLSGEAATGAQEAAFQITNEFLSLLVDSVHDEVGTGSMKIVVSGQQKKPKATASAQRLRIWGAAYGSTNGISGDPNGIGSHDLATRTFGFATGFDYKVSPNTTVGVALAGGGTSWNLPQGLGSGRSDVFQTGVYGSSRFDKGYVSGALAYGLHGASTSRVVTVDGNDQLNGSFVAQTFGGRLEAGYHLTSSPFRVTPYAALQAQTFRMPGYIEETTFSASPFGLAFDSRTATKVRTEIGSWADKIIDFQNGNKLDLWGRVGFARDWESAPQLAATFLSLPEANFLVNGARPGPNLMLLTSAAEWQGRNGWSFLVKLDGEAAGNALTYRGTARLRHEW